MHKETRHFTFAFLFKNVKSSKNDLIISYLILTKSMPKSKSKNMLLRPLSLGNVWNNTIQLQFILHYTSAATIFLSNGEMYMHFGGGGGFTDFSEKQYISYTYI